METKFNFKSQICTDKNQSERLLALGLKKETADCCYYYYDGEYLIAFAEDAKYPSDIPAWSLGRLFALVNGEDWRAEITLKDERYGIHYGYESYWYDDIFESVIAWIENDIKEGYFNKKYLKEENS
jgi:hypothetical protein